MGGSWSVQAVIQVPMYINSSESFKIVLQLPWHRPLIQFEVLVNHIKADFRVWPVVTECIWGKETPLLSWRAVVSSLHPNSCLYTSPWAYLAFRYVFALMDVTQRTMGMWDPSCSSQWAAAEALLETPAAHEKLASGVHSGFRGCEVTAYMFCRL